MALDSFERGKEECSEPETVWSIARYVTKIRFPPGHRQVPRKMPESEKALRSFLRLGTADAQLLHLGNQCRTTQS